MAATESDLRAFVAASGRNWDQLCQALMWNDCAQFGSAPIVYGSANDAYYATDIVSSDVYSAPPGAFLYLDIGAYGHVAVMVDGGDNEMASSKVREPWGVNAGATAIADYIAKTGAWPLGWGWTNGANDFTFLPQGGPPPPPEDEEGEMVKIISTVTATSDGRNRRLFVAAGTGWYYEFTEAGSDYAVKLQDGWDTGSSIGLNDSLMNALKAAGDRVNNG